MDLLIVRLRNNQTAGSVLNTETSTSITYISPSVFDIIQSLLAHGSESRCLVVKVEMISNSIAISAARPLE